MVQSQFSIEKDMPPKITVAFSPTFTRSTEKQQKDGAFWNPDKNKHFWDKLIACNNEVPIKYASGWVSLNSSGVLINAAINFEVRGKLNFTVEMQ